MTSARPDASQGLALTVDAEIDAQFAVDVDLALLRRVITRLLASDGLHGQVEVSLVITDDDTLRRLNLSYRGIDLTTDVLSFPLQSAEELVFVVPPDDVLRLGDVVISFPRAKEQADDYGHSLRREVAYLAAHGVLHLLGYDHEDEAERRVMRVKEEAALGAEADTVMTGE